jgi:transposase
MAILSLNQQRKLVRERSIAMTNSNTKKVKRLDEKTLLVTVDIGKTRNTGYCRFPNGTEIKPFEFHNDGRGFQKFWECISGTKGIHHLEKVVMGFESTGPYAEPLLHFLKKREVRLVQVNPLHTKKLKEVNGNSPGKTDNKDPKVIADIIELGHALTVIIPESEAAELRRLTQARERSVQRRTALFNQLQDLVFLIFPEFLEIMKDIKSKTARYLLKTFPTPDNIVKHTTDDLAKVLKKISRGKIGEKRAEEIYNGACESIGIREGQQSIVLEISEIISTVETCERFTEQVEKEMSLHLKRIPYSACLLSIKGLGTTTVAGLIGEVADFKEFRTISEIMKHAGLDLYEISSGKRKGRRRISKRGRPLLRKLLYFAALNMVRTNGVMRKYYEQYHKRMNRPKALIAIARKLLRTIFALVRDNTVFVHNYPAQPIQFKEAA